MEEGRLSDYVLNCKKGYCGVEDEHDGEEQGRSENESVFAHDLSGNVLSNQVAFEGVTSAFFSVPHGVLVLSAGFVFSCLCGFNG